MAILTNRMMHARSILDDSPIVFIFIDILESQYCDYKARVYFQDKEEVDFCL